MLIQILFSACFLLALVTTWRRAKQQAVTVFEAVIWSVLWVAALVVVWYPGFASLIAFKLGVGRGADLVVYSSIIILFWIIFRVFVRLEAMERKLTSLVRAEALHEFDEEIADELKK